MSIFTLENFTWKILYVNNHVRVVLPLSHAFPTILSICVYVRSQEESEKKERGHVHRDVLWLWMCIEGKNLTINMLTIIAMSVFFSAPSMWNDKPPNDKVEEKEWIHC